MKNYLIFLIMTSSTLLTSNNSFAFIDDWKIHKDSLKKNEPKVDIKVNKKYDDYGNLIQYDSTYSYIYSSPNSDINSLEIDSIIGNFKPYFYNNIPDIFDNSLDNFFNSKPFSNEDFFNNDFFEKQFQFHNKLLEDMINKMDSIRNEFLKQQYPNIKPNNNNNSKQNNQKNNYKEPDIKDPYDL